MAFEGIDASELYPCVLFYSTIFGEKVIISRINFCSITVFILICVFLSDFILLAMNSNIYEQ